MDAPLTPRQQLVTVAHAFKADVALSVPDSQHSQTANIVSVDFSKITNVPNWNGRRLESDGQQRDSIPP